MEYGILLFSHGNCKVPEGTLQLPCEEINIAKTVICCINNSFETLEMNDVLENILLLLQYIKKCIENKAFLVIFVPKTDTCMVCRICRIPRREIYENSNNLTYLYKEYPP